MIKQFYKMRQILLFLFISILDSCFIQAQPNRVEGTFVNGTYNNNIGTLSDRGAVLGFRTQSTNTNTNSTVLFNNSGFNYNPKWVANNANPYTKNTRIAGGAVRFTSGGTDINFGTTNGYYYTFLIGKNAGTDNDLSILETSFEPRDITSVSGAPNTVCQNQPVTVSVTLSGGLQTGEKLFVRYSTDNFSTSNFVEINSLDVSHTGTASIPGQAIGTTVKYYALTSNVNPTHADADYQTLNFRNSIGQNVQGANFTYTVSAWTSISNGNWNTPATWNGNAVPPTDVSVTINHNVTLDVNATVSNLTINSGATFNVGTSTLSLLAGGSITNNGTFNAAAGTIHCLGNATLPNGTYYNITTSGTLNLSGTATITNNLQINDLGTVTGNAPTYTNTSTLIYNRSNGANYALTTSTLEWTGTGITVGSGTPQNVTLINASGTGNFTLQFVGVQRGMAGNLTIGANTTFQLGSAVGDDLHIGGNFIRDGAGVFNANNRAVFFKGGATQTISGENTAFSYLVLDKSAELVQLNDNISVTATLGNVLEFLGNANANVIELNGKVLTLSGTGGNINLGNNATIQNELGTFSPGFPSGLLITGNKQIINGGSNKVLTIGTKAGIRIMSGATLSANPANIATANTKLIISASGGMDIRQPINNAGANGAFFITFLDNSFLITNQELNNGLFNNNCTVTLPAEALNVVYSLSSGNINVGALLPSTLSSLTINHTGGQTVTATANLTVDNLVLNAGVLNISGAETTITAGITRVNGTLQTSNTSDLIINIPNNFSIPNGLFHNSPAPLQDLQVNNNGNTLSLGNQSLTIDGTVTMTSGVLNLNGNNIFLGTSGGISEDVNAGHIIRDATATTDTGNQGGYIEATGRTVDVNSSAIAGLGVFLKTTGGSYNDLTVRRFHYTASNGVGVRLVYGLNSPSVASNPTRIGFRNLHSTENPNNLTLNQVYRWQGGTGWSSIATDNSGCFGALLCTTSGQTSFSHWTIGQNNIPLPISLVKFEGKALNSTQAKLTWQTASEQNNQYFEVEKSIDGQNFEKIITVDGAGNSSILRNYSVIDNDFRNMAYYRLRQKDFNGASTLSHVMIVKGNTENLLVYPNPTKGEIFIQSDENKDSILRWRLLDMTGKEIISDHQKLENIEKTLSNHLQQQRKGLYLIEIYTQQQVYRQRLLVE